MRLESLIEGSEFDTLRGLVATCARLGMAVAEIGVHRGGTAISLWQEIQSYQGVMHCIDIWEEYEIYRLFIEAVDSLKRLRFYRMPSLDAVKLFPDDSLDLVFIDADHRFSSVYADILAWMPKVRQGGVLCGHDCEERYSVYAENQRYDIDFNLETDSTKFTCHAGVIRALYDIFKDEYELLPRIWWVKRAV